MFGQGMTTLQAMTGGGAQPQPQQQQWQSNANGLRSDGSQKGQGFLGVIKRPAGGVSTELSVGVNLNGKDIEIPTLVPTLTDKERQYLIVTVPQNINWKSGIGKGVMQKAVEHAKARMDENKPVFATAEDTMNYRRIQEKRRVDSEMASKSRDVRSNKIEKKYPVAMKVMGQGFRQLYDALDQ